ncbi:MAG: hypothetical protein ABII27_01960, partial [bacterium]
MRKFIISNITVLFITGLLCASGLHFGMTGAVKSKKKEVDKKVREKKINDANATANANVLDVPNKPSSLEEGISPGQTNSMTEISLVWIDNSDNEEYFVIERALDYDGVPGTWKAITDILPANTVTYLDTGLTPNTKYWYRVKAVGFAGESEYSNTVSLHTSSVLEDLIPILNPNKYYSSICLDNSGNPHVVWRDSTFYIIGEICYLKWNGTSWVDADGTGQESINIASCGIDYFSYLSLRLDNSENPHVVWCTDWEIYYLKWNGTSWVDADGSGQESINISNNSGDSVEPSLYLDNSRNPHVVWRDSTSGNAEIYYLRWNGTSWVDADGTGQESINIASCGIDNFSYLSLRLDNSENPHVVWCTNWEICYLKWNGTSWVDADGSGQELKNISNNSGISVEPSLYLDNSRNPHVVWRDSTSGNAEIYYLRWNGTSWVDADG